MLSSGSRESSTRTAGLRLVESRVLGEHRSAWDRLAARSPEPTHSLASWWLEAVGATEPLFLLVFDGEGLVGGLPLEVERWRSLPRFRVLGYRMWPTDFDVVAESSRYDAVVEAIGSWFRARDDYLIELRGLTGSTRLPHHAPRGAEARPIPPTWTAPLGSDIDDYLGSLSRGFRKEVGRLRRKFTREGFTTAVAAPEELPQALATLEELHRLQFGSESTFLPFFDRFSRAAGEGIRSGHMLFHTLFTPEGVPVAIDVWIRAGRRLLNYIGGRHPDGPTGAGSFLIASAIEDAYTRGIDEISLGSGFGGWKERWAPERHEQLLLTGAVGIRATTYVKVRDAALATRRLLTPKRRRDG